MDVPEPPPGECYVGEGKLDRLGYRRINRDGRELMAHRVAWERVNGPIPEGLVIDHLCRNRECANVNHMEVVTKAVNTMRGLSPAALNARKQQCDNGHDFDDVNTYVRPDTGRGCMTCRREAVNRYRAKRRAK